MKLDDESRTRIFADVVCTIDPSGTDVELQVNGTWHDATWLGTPVHRAPMGDLPERWLQRARTTSYFAGPGVPPGDVAGATVLEEGRYETQVRLSLSGDIIVGHSSVITVED